IQVMTGDRGDRVQVLRGQQDGEAGVCLNLEHHVRPPDATSHLLKGAFHGERHAATRPAGKALALRTRVRTLDLAAAALSEHHRHHRLRLRLYRDDDLGLALELAILDAGPDTFRSDPRRL